MLTIPDRTAMAGAAILATLAYSVLTPIGEAASVSVRQSGNGSVSVRSVETSGDARVSVRVNGEEVDLDGPLGSALRTSDAGHGVRVVRTPTARIEIRQSPTDSQWADSSYRSRLWETQSTHCAQLLNGRVRPCQRGMARAQVMDTMDAYRAWYRRWVEELRREVAGYADRGNGMTRRIAPWSWRLKEQDWRSNAWGREVFWF